MTRKKKRVKIGKVIRNQTGVKLPIAMSIAKAVLNWDVWNLSDKHDCVHKEVVGACSCCMSTHQVLCGPKGNLDLTELELNVSAL